ncbi:hypothetical protein F7725_003300 [Dissostichus mawsoni]|uniref:IMS import disulfide relay-system CHCH-CHCH-like Cx9C domain-containing protein n=1 Tax=Dissostichus mawsoni TaxID=36200 RepID=A0A7J5Y9U6_DISMA|nr:hypothetical protein F7725_003300 [Dissostichus mawsoni]
MLAVVLRGGHLQLSRCLDPICSHISLFLGVVHCTLLTPLPPSIIHHHPVVLLSVKYDSTHGAVLGPAFGARLLNRSVSGRSFRIRQHAKTRKIAAMDITAKYCNKEMEAYGSCVASNPSTWQSKCHELKINVAQCTSSHPVIQKIRQECSGVFVEFERCLRENPDTPASCSPHVARFLACAESVDLSGIRYLSHRSIKTSPISVRFRLCVVALNACGPCCRHPPPFPPPEPPPPSSSSLFTEQVQQAVSAVTGPAERAQTHGALDAGLVPGALVHAQEEAVCDGRLAARTHLSPTSVLWTWKEYNKAWTETQRQGQVFKKH